MLECRELRKSYKKQPVVDGLSFEVQKGEAFALLGSNGAGKTTTIKMILGLVQKESGEINIEDGKVGLEDSKEASRQHCVFANRS